MDNNQKTHKILMIEDDIFMRKVYKDQLSRAGFEFIEATNGVEGLNKARSENPNLILLDIMLPQKNGFEVLEELKLDEKLKDIPIIILTNLGSESDILKGKELGANDYLVKTESSMKEVIEKIRYQLAAQSIK